MKLRDYQDHYSSEAAKLLREYSICCLAFEVRTGKTLTALAAAAKYGAQRVLFVTKKKAIGSIEGDYEDYNPQFQIDVTNFEQLHNYAGDPDLVIIDECHSISQYPIAAERTKLLKRICEGLPIIYLSGTFTPESFSQIYHILWVSGFSPFKEWASFYKWAKEFVTVKKKYIYNREINDYSNADKEKIDKYTSHLFLSYTQQEAGFEQAVQEEVLKIKMQPGTYWLADKLKRSRVHIGKGGEEIIADTEVKLMQKLHQVYSGTVIDEKGQPVVFDRSKANFIRQHFAGKKIAIFYKFKAELIAIRAAYGEGNLTESPESFNHRDDLTFVSQIQSGREGINLATADCLVMYNIDFSSVSYQQARARIQSKDRTKAALLYWVFSKGGIEEEIYKRVIKKQDFTLAYFKKVYKGFIASAGDGVLLIDKL